MRFELLRSFRRRALSSSTSAMY